MVDLSNLGGVLGPSVSGLVGGLADQTAATVDTVVGDVAGAVTGLGDPQPDGDVLGDVGAILNGGDPGVALSDAVGQTGEAIGHLGSGVANTVEGAGQILDQPLPDTLNNVVDDVHRGLELAAHDLGLGGTVHGLTTLGETIGLGDLGGDNLLTDVLDLPTTIASGDLSSVAGDALGEINAILDAAPDPVRGLVYDADVGLSDSNGDALGGLLGGADDLTLL